MHAVVRALGQELVAGFLIVILAMCRLCTV